MKLKFIFCSFAVLLLSECCTVCMCTCECSCLVTAVCGTCTYVLVISIIVHEMYAYFHVIIHVHSFVWHLWVTQEVKPNMIEQIEPSHYLRQLEDIRDGDIICFQRCVCTYTYACTCIFYKPELYQSRVIVSSYVCSMKQTSDQRMLGGFQPR